MVRWLRILIRTLRAAVRTHRQIMMRMLANVGGEVSSEESCVASLCVANATQTESWFSAWIARPCSPVVRAYLTEPRVYYRVQRYAASSSPPPHQHQGIVNGGG